MSDSDEKKIIIDEDWKSQIEREREELKQKEESAEPTAEPPEMGQLPPASFPFLISTLATQALAAMGQLPDPTTGQPLPPQPELAKHHIDTMSMLQEKTSGNLETEEATMLEETLHQLRMLFVAK